MNDVRNNPQKNSKLIIPLGTVKLDGSGTYFCGLVKLRPDKNKDLLDSANSFLKAAARCLNGCKVEEGVEILIVPGTVCASFACELFLKYIILIETRTDVKGHSLFALFNECSNDIQSALIKLNANIVEILKRNDKHFLDVRYHHEKEIISFRHHELLQTAQLLAKFVEERYAPTLEKKDQP